jgi:hypothetical protein
MLAAGAQLAVSASGLPAQETADTMAMATRAAENTYFDIMPSKDCRFAPQGTAVLKSLLKYPW